MEIRFVSSLTAEDESLFAPALLKAVGAILDQLPIAYTIRIQTTGAQTFQHSHTLPDGSPATAPADAVSSSIQAVAQGFGRPSGALQRV